MQVKIDPNKIKALHEQGMSRKAIAAETGYPLKAINFAFGALGIKREKTVYVLDTPSETTNIVDTLNAAMAADDRDLLTFPNTSSPDVEL